MKDNNIKIHDIILLFLLVFIIYFGCFYILISTIEILTIIPIMLAVIYIFYTNKKHIFKKIENVYLVLAVIFGIGILFTIPPLNVPDEQEHFTKSYSLTSSVNKDDRGLMHYNTDMYKFVRNYNYNRLNKKIKFNGRDSFSQLSMITNHTKEGKVKYNYKNVKNNINLPYLHQQ